VATKEDATVKPWHDEKTGRLSSLPAPERAIFFVAAKEDATVKPWHDVTGRS
jgi:hypothetical protein